MKLPNFFKSAPLNDLKRRMGVAVDQYGSFAADGERLTAEERVLLQSGEGIEVSFDQLTVLPDKTLAYKDSRVLLYIRDVHVYSSRQREDWYRRYQDATRTAGESREVAALQCALWSISPVNLKRSSRT